MDIAIIEKPILLLETNNLQSLQYTTALKSCRKPFTKPLNYEKVSFIIYRLNYGLNS